MRTPEPLSLEYSLGVGKVRVMREKFYQQHIDSPIYIYVTKEDYWDNKPTMYDGAGPDGIYWKRLPGKW